MLFSQRFTKIKQRQDGFLLVDSIVGVLILAIGLTALAVLYMQGTDASVKADKMQAAVQVAGQEMERLKKADGKSLSEAQEIVGEVKAASGSGNINYDDDKYVAMQGYTPAKADGTGQDRFEIATTLTLTPVGTAEGEDGSAESGKIANYPVSVKVTWYDPNKSEYTVYGYIMVQN